MPLTIRGFRTANNATGVVLRTSIASPRRVNDTSRDTKETRIISETYARCSTLSRESNENERRFACALSRRCHADKSRQKTGLQIKSQMAYARRATLSPTPTMKNSLQIRIVAREVLNAARESAPQIIPMHKDPERSSGLFDLIA